MSNMNIEANRVATLEVLKTNREKHRGIVEESRKGYMEKAEAALKTRLDSLRSGKLVSLTFALAPPQDHTKVYDTAIKMLEMHTGETITLDADNVRKLVLDEWNWQRTFLTSNANYSGTARRELEHLADQDD